MLLSLYIKNFILIEEINLDLSGDFNVFTGETGAGKSLFVDALNFVSGERSTASVVGPKADSSLVEAVFSVENNPKVQNELDAMGFDVDEQGLLVFSREMNRNGRSIARINRRVVSLKEIRGILSSLIDIHSQHDTHTLLNSKNHLHLLQAYIKDDTLLLQYQDCYNKYQAKLKEIAALHESVLDDEALSYASFILNEIESLNPSVEDYETIDKSLKDLENFEKKKQELNTMESTLRYQDDVIGKLHSLLPLFSNLEELETQFKDIYYQLEDLTLEISRLNDGFLFDEYEYEALNTRMSQYTKMIRKYGSLEKLLSKKEELETQIQKAKNFENYKIDLQNELDDILISLESKANALSLQRKKNAKALEKVIIKELADLSLENAVFEIHFETVDYNNQGSDKVQFMISMNKGMPVANLSQVASGGELSRLMLALKVVFSQMDESTTLIFDEIDTGVSGTVAFKIGQKMRQISKSNQVIAITHLPAVAVCAQHHYLISKIMTNDATKTQVELMSSDKRKEHLAIMMMGVLNEDSMNAASHLLEEGAK